MNLSSSATIKEIHIPNVRRNMDMRRSSCVDPEEHVELHAKDGRKFILTIPEQKVTPSQLVKMLPMRGCLVGKVVPGNEWSGQAIYAIKHTASQARDGGFDLRTKEGQGIPVAFVGALSSEDRTKMSDKLKTLETKCEGLTRSQASGHFSDFEFHEMIIDPRLLDVGFALMRHKNLIPKSAELFPSEENIITDSFDSDFEKARRLCEDLTKAFPEVKDTLNSLSIARAAGYWVKYEDTFPLALKTKSTDARWDIYLVKASARFWQAEGMEGDSSSDDEYNANIYHQEEKLPPSRPRLLFSNKSDITKYAEGYDMAEYPEFWTTSRQARHSVVIRSVEDLKSLTILSLVFSTILDGPPPTNRDLLETYENYITPVGSLRENPGLRSLDEQEMAIFCQPPLYTKHFNPVMEKHIRDGDNIQLSPLALPHPGNLADFTPYHIVALSEYRRAIEKCFPFAPNGISVILLTQIMGNLGDLVEFWYWRDALATCIKENWLAIDPKEMESWSISYERELRSELSGKRSLGKGDDDI